MRVTADVKLATEKAIRAAAKRLFVRRGVEGTSTRQIAAAAGIGVGTLFNYFASKEALAVAIAAEGFAAGRESAAERVATLVERGGSLEEELFALAAADIRALEPIRGLVGEVLEAGMSPLVSGGTVSPEAAAIRTGRLEDAAAVLARHGLGDAATAPVMHLYWSLYLGVLSFWAADPSPKQEDTWALLDRSVRMFAGALQRETGAGPPPTAAEPRAISTTSTLGAAGSAEAAEVKRS